MSEAIQTAPDTVVEETTQPGVITEHEQAMVDLVDNTEAAANGQANPDEATDYVEPDEATPEIDYKAEYEKLLADKENPTEEAVESKPVVEPSEEPSLVTPDALDAYTKEFNSDGGLSDESYKKLEADGYSKAIVDNYIQGQAAIAQAQTQKVFDKTGGPEQYNEMIQWAKDTWSKDQVSIFNEQVNSGNETQIMYGVDALTAQYKAANSGIPNRVLKGSGGSGSATNSLGYSDKGEMYKAMDNRLYGKDASYTQMVTKKIGLSKF